MERNYILKRKENCSTPLAFHDGPVPYFSIPAFDSLGLKNGFSTKFGGISEGFCAEMNLSPTREPIEIVRENYRIFCRTLCMDEKRAVLTYQTHTVNVREALDTDAGKGPFCDREYVDVDGLVTNVPGLPLVTLHADCVPLYFYDPVHHAIGLAHAGWRGTLNRMAEKVLVKMNECYDTSAEEVIAAIGPSICGSCYEVGTEVAEQFMEQFEGAGSEGLVTAKTNGKYLLDLWRVNALVMKEAGICPENITTGDICTKCNSELLFSHRAVGDRRGLLAAMLCL